MSKGNDQKELSDNLDNVMASLKTDDARDQMIKVVLTSNEVDKHIKTLSNEVHTNKSNEKITSTLKWWSHVIIPVTIANCNSV